MARAGAVHLWPAAQNAPTVMSLVARSRSASSRTTWGFLPPISRPMRTRRSAHLRMIDLPTSTEPVKEMALMRGSLVSGEPTFSPSPVRRLKTPGGRPGSSRRWGRSWVVFLISEPRLGAGVRDQFSKALEAASMACSTSTALEDWTLATISERWAGLWMGRVLAETEELHWPLM